MIKKVILAFAALLLVLPAAACGPAPAEEIKIGAIMDLTGELAGMGPKIKDGVVLAVNEINAAGGINGKQVRLIVEDGATDVATGLEAAKKLVEVNGVKVIIGPMISGATLATGPYVGEREVLIISPSATSPDIADQDWRQFVFRTCPIDKYQGLAMSQLVIEGGYEKVALFIMDNQYGVGIEEVVIENLTDKVEIVISIRYDPVKLDYLTELQLVKDQNPDAVIHVGYGDDAEILYKQALDLGLDTAQWIAAEGVYAEATLETPETAEFMSKAVIGTKPSAPEGLAAYDEFAADFEAEFGTPTGVYSDTAYDAMKLVALAIEQAGYEDAAAISAALLTVGQDYEGVSGTISFAENGDRKGGSYEVWKVVKEDGEYKYERIKVISL